MYMPGHFVCPKGEKKVNNVHSWKDKKKKKGYLYLSRVISGRIAAALDS
jgi:hypothetical protein